MSRSLIVSLLVRSGVEQNPGPTETLPQSVKEAILLHQELQRSNQELQRSHQRLLSLIKLRSQPPIASPDSNKRSASRSALCDYSGTHPFRIPPVGTHPTTIFGPADGPVDWEAAVNLLRYVAGSEPRALNRLLTALATRTTDNPLRTRIASCQQRLYRQKITVGSALRAVKWLASAPQTPTPTTTPGPTQAHTTVALDAKKTTTRTFGTQDTPPAATPDSNAAKKRGTRTFATQTTLPASTSTSRDAKTTTTRSSGTQTSRSPTSPLRAADAAELTALRHQLSEAEKECDSANSALAALEDEALQLRVSLSMTQKESDRLRGRVAELETTTTKLREVHKEQVLLVADDSSDLFMDLRSSRTELELLRTQLEETEIVLAATQKQLKRLQQEFTVAAPRPSISSHVTALIEELMHDAEQERSRRLVLEAKLQHSEGMVATLTHVTQTLRDTLNNTQSQAARHLCDLADRFALQSSKLMADLGLGLSQRSENQARILEAWSVRKGSWSPSGATSPSPTPTTTTNNN